MKRSSFKQFFILKKIYGMPVNWAWSFEQTLNGSQLGFTIGTILAIFDLRVTPMLPTKFRVNWPFKIFKMAAMAAILDIRLARF